MPSFRESAFSQIRKRDGRLVPFDEDRIVRALSQAMEASQEGDLTKDPRRLSTAVVAELNRRYPPTHTPKKLFKKPLLKPNA